MRRALVVAAIAGVASFATGCTEPARGQVVLHVTTDAPLPPPPGQALEPHEPAPLFDTMLFELYSAGESEPCAGCSRSFDIDRAMVAAGDASIGVIAEAGESRLRVRMYVASAERGAQPSSAGSVEAWVRIPAQSEGVVESLHVVLPSERVSRPLGSSDVPIDAAPGEPDPGLVGSWPAAQRRGCAGSIPEGMVCVPGGAFWMGDSSQIGAEADVRRLVALSPFFIDATEVTVEEFKTTDSIEGTDWFFPTDNFEFCTVPAGDFSPEQGPRAVNCVRRIAAETHCAARGASLPTEAQLEYLMGGLRSTRFPWGDGVPGCSDAIFARWTRGGGELKSADCRVDSDVPGPRAAGSGSRDVLSLPSGKVFDLAGNVAEWAADSWNRQGEPCWQPGVHLDPFCSEPSLADGSRFGVLRGGDWSEPPSVAHAARRRRFDLELSEYEFGFRCVGHAEPPVVQPPVVQPPVAQRPAPCAQFGGSGQQSILSMNEVADLYVAIGNTGVIDQFPQFPSSGERDVLVVQYLGPPCGAPAEPVAWFDGSNDVNARIVSYSPMVVAGDFRGTLHVHNVLNSTEQSITSLDRDIFVFDLDADRLTTIASSGGDETVTAASRYLMHQSGTPLVIVGNMTAPADFGGGAIGDSQHGFVVQLSDSGAHQWSRAFNLGNDAPLAVVVPDPGFVVVGGTVSRPINFGDGPQASLGGSDAFLLWLDDLGNTDGSEVLGSSGDDGITDLAGQFEYTAVGYVGGVADVLGAQVAGRGVFQAQFLDPQVSPPSAVRHFSGVARPCCAPRQIGNSSFEGMAGSFSELMGITASTPPHGFVTFGENHVTAFDGTASALAWQGALLVGGEFHGTLETSTETLVSVDGADAFLLWASP
jgi:sulfatase modifying factor 1